MSNTPYTVIRKRISLHAKILASILFVELAFYAISPFFQLPAFAYAVFPSWIWGGIAITNGPTYLVVSSVLLLMACASLLFIWGHAYLQKERYILRLRIWFTLFSILLGYNWMVATVTHITALFPLKNSIPLPAGVAPIGFQSRDYIMSRASNTPPVHSMEFVLFFTMLLLYTAESLWVHCLLAKAQKLQSSRVVAKGASNS